MKRLNLFITMLVIAAFVLVGSPGIAVIQADMVVAANKR